MIELLVVFAIIAILLAIIATGVSTVRERARFNKILQFSRSVHNWLVEEGAGVWGFDEGSGNETADTSANAATLDVSSATWIEDGALNSALNFDGTSSVLNVPKPLFVNQPKQFTVSLWARPQSSFSSTDQVLFSHSEKGEFYVGYNTDNEFFFAYRNASGSWNTLVAPGAVAAEVWHHVAATWNEVTNEAKIYVDGQVKATTAAGSGLYSSLDTPAIGARANGGPSQHFTGDIDEVEIYEAVF